MDEIVKKILKNIDNKGSYSIIFDDEKDIVEIKRENFHDIGGASQDNTIAFVDGGSLEILKSPSLSLFFNRIYYTIYTNNKRTQNKKFEFYTLITASGKKKKIFYNTEYFFTEEKIKLKKYEFDSQDMKLSFSNRRADISLMGNVIRRFAELAVAGSIKAEYVVIDGSLEAKYPHEEELIPDNIYGLSKTTELLTENGNSVAAALSDMAEKETWYYDAGEVSFVKLHPKSKYIFRLDSRQDISGLLPLLKENSKDPLFLGYPYGLVEADRFARISRKERESLQLQLQMKFKKDFEKLIPYIKSQDAHDVLDNIG